MKVLFLSYDGLTDPLGSSQIIPYLRGLANAGHEIHILSSEKPSVFREREQEILKSIKDTKIKWWPLTYHKKPPILSTVWDLFCMALKAKQLHKEYRFDLFHCRSYIPSLVGMWLKRRFGRKFLFDMRGFWADERVDGGLWNQDRWIYQLVYKFFKNRERCFLNEADHTICLTHLAKDILLDWVARWPEFYNRKLPISVIPCCVDLTLFDPKTINPTQVEKLRATLGFSKNEFILTYLGSIGTWYMLDEMLLFFKSLLKARPDSRFLFITPEHRATIENSANRIEIPPSKLAIVHAKHALVPTYLSLASAGISFIKPVFSKKGSSPTKLGEMLSMGIPVISNANVGDSNWLAQTHHVGPLVGSFDPQEFDRAIERLQEFKSTAIRATAQGVFSLEKGLEVYKKIYDNLSHNGLSQISNPILD